MSKDLKTIALRDCVYIKDKQILYLTSNYIGMPYEFYVQSNITGRTVLFRAIGPEDKLFNQDQWDGEQQIYRPVGAQIAVDHMVIHNI